MFEQDFNLQFSEPLYFQRHDERLGDFNIRPLDLEAHINIVHQWCVKNYASFWNMQRFDLAALRAFYQRMQRERGEAAFIGFHHDQPAFLVEIYNPCAHKLAEYYAWQRGDFGMHLLVAPPIYPQANFTLAVMRTVMEFLFDHLNAKRAVVEPDIRNHKIHRLNERVGFQHIRPVVLPEKIALLGLCDEAHYRETLLASKDCTQSADSSNQRISTHLTPHDYAQANRLLLRKIIVEFTHEQLLKPVRG